VKKALGSNLVGLRFFGSKARGKASRDSDIDNAVVVQQRNAGAWDNVIEIKLNHYRISL